MNRSILNAELSRLVGKLSIQGLNKDEYTRILRQIKEITEKFLEEQEKKN